MSRLDTLDRKRLRQLVSSAAPAARAVILIGSFARGTAVRPMSDLDVLVITDDPPDGGNEIHIVSVSAERFRERVLSGDDFAQWAVRFGLPVSGRAWWAASRKELASVGPWPAADEKL